MPTKVGFKAGKQGQDREPPQFSPQDHSAKFNAMRFTDTESYFVSEASVYRLLKAHDLIASPAFIVMKAAGEFKDKPRRQINSGRPISPI